MAAASAAEISAAVTSAASEPSTLLRPHDARRPARPGAYPGQVSRSIERSAGSAVPVIVVPAEGTAALAALLSGGRTVVLTGAGMSTDSGIPDYRGPQATPRRPMTYTEFRSGAAAQRRYWARSHVGWIRMGRADPNPGHRALAALESAGALRAVITQNVDGLHQAAGSRQVVELHGSISEVVCLSCEVRTDRLSLHRRLTELNPGFAQRFGPDVDIAPDGDAAIDSVAGFRLAYCDRCGGALKPNVVFFGENVPKDRVAECYALVDDADALVVCGSSLTVMSGLRFVRHARRKRDIPVAILNRGATRGDDLATMRVDGGCSEVLAGLTGTA